MANSVLDCKSRKNIIYDVLDGIPESEDQNEAGLRFRREIEHDDLTLQIRATELGIENSLLEFTSSGEI